MVRMFKFPAPFLVPRLFHQLSSTTRTQDKQSSACDISSSTSYQTFVYPASLSCLRPPRKPASKIVVEPRLRVRKYTMPSLTLQLSLFLLTAFGLGTTSASPLRIREASPQMLVPLSDGSSENPRFKYPPDMAHSSPANPPLLPLPPIPTVPLPPILTPKQLLARDEGRPPRSSWPRTSKSSMPKMKNFPRGSRTTKASTFEPEVRVEEPDEDEETYEFEPREQSSSGCHHETKRGNATLEEVFDDDDTDQEKLLIRCLTTEEEMRELCNDGERDHILCSRLFEPTDL